MTSLHITHTVRDFDEWLTAFNEFADFRAQGGVTALTVRRGVDDPAFVVVDLELDTAAQAQALLEQLQTQVWPSSPHLTGQSVARILESVGVAVEL